MSDNSKRFTDNNLKLLYGNLLDHYYNYLQSSKTPDLNIVYTEMFSATQYAVESPSGSLYTLDRDEKNKVYRAFEAIFRSLPVFTQLSAREQSRFNPKQSAFNPGTVNVLNPLNIYNCIDAAQFHWLHLSSMNYRCYKTQTVDIKISGSVNKSSVQKDKVHADDEYTNSAIKMTLGMVLATIATCGTILSAFALYYMFEQSLNCIERLWYHEGWLKATVLCANSLAFGSASTILTLMFAATPLSALAVAIGITPVGFVIAATVCLTLLGAGIGCLATDLLYDVIENKLSTDSMDAKDPCRYRVTEPEENTLIEKYIDPIKVRCAIVAIRSEISRIQENEETVPSFLSRQYGEGKKVQKLLQQVRELRSGTLTVVSIGNLCFDCRYPVVTRFNQLTQIHEPHYFFANTANQKVQASVLIEPSLTHNSLGRMASAK